MSAEKKYKSLQSSIDAIKHLTPSKRQKVLALLVKKDPQLAQLLAQSVFEFQDLPSLAKTDFKFLWFEIPRQIWLLALRSASNELLLFIRSCQTERAFKELLEDLKSLGPQPASQVAKAQMQLMEEIHSLAKQGRIHLPNKLKKG